MDADCPLGLGLAPVWGLEDPRGRSGPGPKVGVKVGLAVLAAGTGAGSRAGLWWQVLLVPALPLQLICCPVPTRSWDCVYPAPHDPAMTSSVPPSDWASVCLRRWPRVPWLRLGMPRGRFPHSCPEGHSPPLCIQLFSEPLICGAAASAVCTEQIRGVFVQRDYLCQSRPVGQARCGRGVCVHTEHCPRAALSTAGHSEVVVLQPFHGAGWMAQSSESLPRRVLDPRTN